MINTRCVVKLKVKDLVMYQCLSTGYFGSSKDSQMVRHLKVLAKSHNNSRSTAPERSTTPLDSQGWTPHFPSTRWPPCSPFLSDLPKIEACTTINFWDAAIDDHLAPPILFINLDFITQNWLTIFPYTILFLNLESITGTGAIVSPYYVLGCDDLWGLEIQCMTW